MDDFRSAACNFNPASLKSDLKCQSSPIPAQPNRPRIRSRTRGDWHFRLVIESIKLLPEFSKQNAEVMTTCAFVILVLLSWVLRESLFNITRGDEDIEGGGGSPKSLDTRKGGLWKNCWARRGGGGFRKFVYFKTNRRRGEGFLKLNLPPPPPPFVILNELSLTYAFAVKRN